MPSPSAIATASGHSSRSRRCFDTRPIWAAEVTMLYVVTSDSARSDLALEVADIAWYHTIELPGGVITPGEYDTRVAARKVGLPADLDGNRCLDVGTHDGFWAFEMERRGAT